MSADLISHSVDKKAARAFRTITEVAAELNVPAHVLRFWEKKFSQVAPVQKAGGRRYYRPEDIDLLKKIEFLLHNEGYTIKGVQKLLKDGMINAAVKKKLPYSENKQAFCKQEEKQNISGSDRNLDHIIFQLEEISALLKKIV